MISWKFWNNKTLKNFLTTYIAKNIVYIQQGTQTVLIEALDSYTPKTNFYNPKTQRNKTRSRCLMCHAVKNYGVIKRGTLPNTRWSQELLNVVWQKVAIFIMTSSDIYHCRFLRNNFLLCTHFRNRKVKFKSSML